MKKYILGCLAAGALTFTSCDTIDVDPTGYYSESVAYSSLDNLDMTTKYFYSIFHNVADIETGKGLTAIDDGASDLLKASWYNVEGGCWNKMFFQDNYITVDNGNFRSNWNTMYIHIVRQNQFLYDYERGMIKLPEADVKPRVAEVRFLRAFAYMELVTRHGGVILRTHEGGPDDQHQNNKARSTEAECWDFIINELDAAAQDLPDQWPDDQAGRITRGAAKGMKARAALYARRWQDAIDAANDVINDPHYSLLDGTTPERYNLIYTTVNNPELIMPVYFEVSKKQHMWNTWVGACAESIAASGAESGAAITPTEEYASQFDICVNGKWEAFDWDNIAKYGNKPYDNRDPRFYASILYNGAKWKGREIQFYEGGTDATMEYTGLASSDNVHKSTTGYYIRKFLTAKNYNYVNILSDQYWTEMRLAEIYLIRSEAYARLNQWSNAYADLNMIRSRVGLSSKPATSSWEGYLPDLQKERICELGLEGHRYNDIIRWNIHQQVLNGQRVHGVKVTKNGNDFKYEVIDVDHQDRKFPVKYSIFPIPYSEIQNNPLCEQNDLWK